MSLILDLPLPNTELSPNKKSGRHWSSTFATKKMDRQIGYMLTKQALAHQIIDFDKNDCLLCEMVFIFKNNKHLDDDNALASFKPMQDGIFEALGLDDRMIKKRTIDTRLTDKIHPKLLLTLSKL